MSSKTKVVKLGFIPEKWFLSWVMATQASNKITVTLKDSQKVYVDGKFTAGTPGQVPVRKMLDEGTSRLVGDKLELTIEVENATTMHVKVLPFHEYNDECEVMICGCNVLLEDWSDDDYNDLIVTLVATKKDT